MNERDDLRGRLVEALDNAHKTQPCTCGATYWSYCGHDNKPSHSERRANAVLAALGDYLDEQTRKTVDMAALLQDAERVPALLAKVKRTEEWARREEMARQKVQAQVLILGEQLKKRGVSNAEIAEWIELAS